MQGMCANGIETINLDTLNFVFLRIAMNGSVYIHRPGHDVIHHYYYYYCRYSVIAQPTKVCTKVTLHIHFAQFSTRKTFDRRQQQQQHRLVPFSDQFNSANATPTQFHTKFMAKLFPWLSIHISCSVRVVLSPFAIIIYLCVSHRIIFHKFLQFDVLQRRRRRWRCCAVVSDFQVRMR